MIKFFVNDESFNMIKSKIAPSLEYYNVTDKAPQALIESQKYYINVYEWIAFTLTNNLYDKYEEEKLEYCFDFEIADLEVCKIIHFIKVSLNFEKEEDFDTDFIFQELNDDADEYFQYLEGWLIDNKIISHNITPQKFIKNLPLYLKKYSNVVVKNEVRNKLKYGGLVGIFEKRIKKSISKRQNKNIACFNFTDQVLLKYLTDIWINDLTVFFAKEIKK